MVNKLFMYVAFLSLMIGCNTDEIDVFDSNNYLSFNLPKSKENRSEFVYTFKYIDPSATEKEIALPVTFAGRTDAVDRKFTLKVVDSLTTAVEGVHYKIDFSRNIVPANSYDGHFYVNLLKTDDMEDQSYTLGLEIENDENFKFGDSKTLLVTFSDKIEKPVWWYINKRANIGYYTERKLALWYEFWGITDGTDPWGVAPYGKLSNGKWVPDTNVCAQSRELFKAWLEHHEGAPVVDEYGDIVVLTLYRLER